MKPDVQYLLECYSSDNKYEDYVDFPRSAEHGIPVPNRFGIANLGPRNQAQGGFSYHGFPEQFLHMAPNNQVADGTIYASLNVRQQQQIRRLARSLKTAADSMQIKPPTNLSVQRAIIQNEGLDEDEIKVVNNIYSIKTPATISQIAEYLGEKLTSRTFRATLQFACYSATSVPEELAIACELAKVTRPKLQQLSRSKSIYDVIEDFIEERLRML